MHTKLIAGLASAVTVLMFATGAAAVPAPGFTEVAGIREVAGALSARGIYP